MIFKIIHLSSFGEAALLSISLFTLHGFSREFPHIVQSILVNVIIPSGQFHSAIWELLRLILFACVSSIHLPLPVFHRSSWGHCSFPTLYLAVHRSHRRPHDRGKHRFLTEMFQGWVIAYVIYDMYRGNHYNDGT